MGQDGEDRQDGDADMSSRPPESHVPGRPSSGDRSPAPGDPPVPVPFDDEIRAAVRYERGLAVKALVAIVVVAVVLALRVFLLG